MSKIEELKVAMAAKREERIKEVNELIETRKVENELAIMDTPIYEQRLMQDADIKVLDDHLGVIEESFASDRRKLIEEYSYGTIPNRIISLVKSITFSKKDEKPSFLMMTGLSELQLEDVIDKLGRTPYFSVKEMEITDAVAQDKGIVDALKDVAITLGLTSTVNYDKFSKANVELIYARAQNRAEINYENTVNYVEEEAKYEE